MYTYFIFSILLLVKLSEQKVNISIFYEALCPDSKDFVAHQLAPKYDAIKNDVNLEFVPYGKSNHAFISGKWNVKCHHDFRECELNKYHACGIKYAKSESDQLTFVNCMLQKAESTVDDIKSVRECCTSADIVLSNVTKCYRDGEGLRLLVENGDKTRKHGLTIIEGFIPTIIFNGVYNHDLQDRSQTKFLDVVKEQINRDQGNDTNDECCCCCDCCC